MRAVLQRVTRAAVSWNGSREEIGLGLLVLLGVGPADDEGVAERLARKTAELRIFEDADGRTNRSLEEVGGEALVATVHPRPSKKTHPPTRLHRPAIRRLKSR